MPPTFVLNPELTMIEGTNNRSQHTFVTPKQGYSKAPWMEMYWGIPVLALSIFIFILLWYFYEVQIIGGGYQYGVAFYFAALFGVHFEYVRRQIQQRDAMLEETGE
jgi:hypothetical protein